MIADSVVRWYRQSPQSFSCQSNIREASNCNTLLRGGCKEDNIRVAAENTDNVDLDDVFEKHIRLSEKFLSFYEETIDAEYFLFYIISSNYVRSIFFR